MKVPTFKTISLTVLVLIVFQNYFAGSTLASFFFQTGSAVSKHDLKEYVTPFNETPRTFNISNISSLISEDKFEPCVTTFDRKFLSKKERGLLVFTAPPNLRQQHDLPETIKSWHTALQNRGTLIVFTNDGYTRRVCSKYGIPTMCVEHVDEGLPRLDRMFERMHASQPDGIVAFVNSDIEVKEFGPLYNFLWKLDSGPSLEILKPTRIYKEFNQTGRMSKYWFVAVTRLNIAANGTIERHTGGGYDFWAWNLHQGGIPLLPFDVPPFRFPLAAYDNWLLDVVNQAAQRNVIDATNLCSIYHRHHKTESQGWWKLFTEGVSGVYMNWYLAFHEPRKSLLEVSPSHEYSYVRHFSYFGTSNEAPYYAIMRNGSSTETQLLRRRYWSELPNNALTTKPDCPLNSTCDRIHFVMKKTEIKELFARGLPLAITKPKQPKQSKHEKSAADAWRYTLERQLKTHSNTEGYVLITAVNFVYREHLMNWLCSLARVGMSDHILIGALDEEMYTWGQLQGLPIFKANAQTYAKEAENSAYGSDDFKVVTKLKSKVVLEVLNAGYSAIWCDVDITWFVHPFDALKAYMKGNSTVGIAIQSNAPYVASPGMTAIPHMSVDPVKTDDPTGYRRLNSGLYVAVANNNSITASLVRSAFEEIIDDASRSNLTEQPSFDKILCQRAPSERNYSSCTYRPANRWKKAVPPSSRLQVESLDRFSFPNGAILVGESSENVYALGKDVFEKETGFPLYAAHNNWIKGESAKRERQNASGWWFTDEKYSCRFVGDKKDR